jgi:hypothetical protein
MAQKGGSIFQRRTKYPQCFASLYTFTKVVMSSEAYNCILQTASRPRFSVRDWREHWWRLSPNAGTLLHHT